MEWPFGLGKNKQVTRDMPTGMIFQADIVLQIPQEPFQYTRPRRIFLLGDFFI